MNSTGATRTTCSLSLDPGIAAAIALGLLTVLLAGTALAQTYVLQTTFGSLGNGNGQFEQATGVAIDPVSHNILVSDPLINRLQIFDSTGVYLSQFYLPAGGAAYGVAIDPTTGNIVVVDPKNYQVDIFAPSSPPPADTSGRLTEGPSCRAS